MANIVDAGSSQPPSLRVSVYFATGTPSESLIPIQEMSTLPASALPPVPGSAHARAAPTISSTRPTAITAVIRRCRQHHRSGTAGLQARTHWLHRCSRSGSEANLLPADDHECAPTRAAAVSASRDGHCAAMTSPMWSR